MIRRPPLSRRGPRRGASESKCCHVTVQGRQDAQPTSAPAPTACRVPRDSGPAGRRCVGGGGRTGPQLGTEGCAMLTVTRLLLARRPGPRPPCTTRAHQGTVSRPARTASPGPARRTTVEPRAQPLAGLGPGPGSTGGTAGPGTVTVTAAALSSRAPLHGATPGGAAS
jgi:hypothetical protein